MIQSSFNNIYISHGIVICREHIGSVFYLLSTQCVTNKLYIIKHTNSVVSLLSNNGNTQLNNTFFHLYRTFTEYSNLSYLRVCEISTDFNIRYLEKTLLLEYGFFSQVEWRYLRFRLLQLWFSATVIHSRFNDINLRNYSYFKHFINLRHGHFLVLSSKFKNISTCSFLIGVFYLSIFLSRSRTGENTYEDDYYRYETESKHEAANHICSYSGSDSTDFDVDTHYSVEEQCHISGFFFDNNVCSLSSFNDYMCFSYLHFYTNVSVFFHSLRFSFLCSFFYYFFFLSFFIYVTSTMLYKYMSIKSFPYFLSDYLFQHEYN